MAGGVAGPDEADLQPRVAGIDRQRRQRRHIGHGGRDVTGAGAEDIGQTHQRNMRGVAPGLADLAHRSGTLLVFDAGSGLLLPNDEPVFANEPIVRQAIADGADVVTFSTDKLLGGPQGGGIVGRRDLLQRINRHPLKRAVRVGKMTLAALEAALQAHLRPGAPATPVMSLIQRPLKELERDARKLARAIGRVAPEWKRSIEPDEASIGGGSLPGETVPTVVLWLEAPGLAADALDRAFRLNEPPIFGRFRKGRFGLDLRTLLHGDADDIVACVERLAAPAAQRETRNSKLETE